MIRHVKKIGFHLPKWYSPFSGGTFGIIAKEFLEAKKILEEGDDFAPTRNWRIYNAAIPWEEIAISETEVELMKNKIDLPPLVCPKGTIAVTAGIDPGQGGFWFTVYAWRKDYGGHLIQYGFLPGDYETAGMVEAVREWHYHVDGDERLLPIWRVGIDTGGGQYSEADATMTEAAYLWIRKMRRPGLYGTKGLSRETFHRVRERRIDKMPGDKGAPVPGGLILIEINSDAMKDVMWFHVNIASKETVDAETGEITIDNIPAGRLTFHNGVETDFFNQLLAEERQMQKDARGNGCGLGKAITGSIHGDRLCHGRL